MLSKKEIEEARAMTLKYVERAGILLTEEEKKNIEVVDFGLGDLKKTGVQLLTYFTTSRLCAKEMVLFPEQTCPENRHPPFDDGIYPGREEVVRCRWGKVYLYVPGVRSSVIHASPPEDQKQYYTIWHEVILNPGNQYVIGPNILHWFQAGPEGAVISEFLTNQPQPYFDPRENKFTNPNIVIKFTNPSTIKSLPTELQKRLG